MKCLGCEGDGMRRAYGGKEREWCTSTGVMVADTRNVSGRRAGLVGVAYFQ